MKKYLILALSLLIFTCDDDPSGPKKGCMEIDACNYDANAAVDDPNDPCWYVEEGSTCTCNDAQGATDDECGVCGGDGSSCADCEGIPNGTAVEDCAGTCNGSAEVDVCGVCDGPGLDACGTCDGSIVDLGCGCGEAAPDACGTCDGSIVDLSIIQI